MGYKAKRRWKSRKKEPYFHWRFPGIYAITHVESGKRYVGKSNCLARRLSEHHRKLEYGSHGNRHLQAAWNKYGATAFRFEQIEACFAEDVAISAREQKWIDCHRKNIYNFALVVEPGHTQKTPTKVADKGVIDIFRLYVGGVPPSDIAARYSIHPMYVFAILRRDARKSVKIPEPLLRQATEKRLNRSEGSPNRGRHLPKQIVEQIMLRLRKGETGRRLAEEYKVSDQTICHIKAGKWHKSGLFLSREVAADLAEMPKQPCRFLSSEDVISIAKLYADDVRVEEICDIYNCSENMVAGIVRRKKHLSILIPEDVLRACSDRAKAFARGARNGRNKLTADEVLEIHRLRQSGKTLLVISKMMGISCSSVSRILKGEQQSHLRPA